MKVNGWSPRQTVLCGLAIINFLGVSAQAPSYQYCSPQNTGSGDFQGVDIYNSWSSCPAKCSGFAWAIVQYQSCWCSEYGPGAQYSLSSCNTPCPGFPANACGSRDGDLYGYLELNGPTQTSSPTPTPTPTPTLRSSTSRSRTSASPTTRFTSTPVPVTSVPATTPTSSSFTTFFSPSSVPETSQVQATTITRVVPPHISVTTVSGSTFTVTYRASQTPVPTFQSKAHGQSLSNGATAGIVIGVIIGLALLALLAFLLWRRRRREPEEIGEGGKKPPRRTTSVLSRTGLLSRGRQSMVEQPADESVYTGGTGTTGPNSIRHSMLFGAAGAGAGAGASAGAATAGSHEHTSPAGSGHYYYNGSNSGMPRRSSQPLVYDQRLNPSALFGNHDNGSRVSMQDNNDYSRPLGIANPDPRPSHESRRSNWD